MAVYRWETIVSLRDVHWHNVEGTALLQHYNSPRILWSVHFNTLTVLIQNEPRLSIKVSRASFRVDPASFSVSLLVCLGFHWFCANCLRSWWKIAPDRSGRISQLCSRSPPLSQTTCSRYSPDLNMMPGWSNKQKDCPLIVSVGFKHGTEGPSVLLTTMSGEWRVIFLLSFLFWLKIMIRRSGEVHTKDWFVNLIFPAGFVDVLTLFKMSGEMNQVFAGCIK